MQLRYDDDFIEAGVFLCASGTLQGIHPIQRRRFQAERDRCYSMLDPDERSAAFFKVHLDWFREWELEKALLTPFKDFPLIERSLDLLAFRQARGKNDEGAELYVRNEDGIAHRNAMVALRVQRFEDRQQLTRFLRHEYFHLHDMLDPAFGYSPFVQQTGPSPTQQRITRERYRLLWDVTIDGRLCGDNRKQHEAMFGGAYSFWPETKQRSVFEELWTRTHPTHEDLMALASDPRDWAHVQGASPGAPCPLCSFPTFQWADGPTITPKIAAEVRADFPHWSPEHGACSRCVETYEQTLAAH